MDFSIVLDREEGGVGLDGPTRSSPSGNSYLRGVLKRLPITSNDRIIDIGCGKGSAMRVMLEFPFSRVDGVEISPHIASLARNNFTRLKIPPDRWDVFTADAGDLSELDPYNFVYLYNPFPCDTMKRMMEQLTASIRRANRRVVIIYNNPVCHAEVLSSGMFREIAQYPDE